MTNFPDIGDVELRQVVTVDDAADMLRWLGERRCGRLAVDTETLGLGKFDPREDKIRLLQVGDGAAGWTIDAEGWRALAIDVASHLDNPIFWNSRYDVRCIQESFGIDLDAKGAVDDAMLKSRLLSPRGRHGLKNVASRLMGSSVVALADRLEVGMAENGWTWATVPVDWPPYGMYAALDCVLTSRCDAHLDGQLDTETGVPRPLYSLERRFAAVCRKMEWRGVGVDVEYCVSQRQELLSRAAALLSEWASRGVPLGSRSKVIETLKGAGWTPEFFTESGQAELSARSLKGAPQPAADFLERNKCLKLANTYFLHLINSGGRIHPQINTLQALTGRTSISNPSMQNFPRGVQVRDGIIAGQGQRLITCDYDHLELSIIAALFRDGNLRKALSDGRDIFSELAAQCFGKSSPELRQMFKTTTYSIAYGAGPAKIASTCNIEYETAQTLIETLDNQFREFAYGRRHLPEVALQRDDRHPWVQSRWTGRRWTVPADKAYALVDYAVQGTATDVFKHAVVDLDSAGVPLVLQIHDEVVAETDSGSVEDVRAELERVMPRYLDDVALTASASPGMERLGDKERLRLSKKMADFVREIDDVDIRD